MTLERQIWSLEQEYKTLQQNDFFFRSERLADIRQMIVTAAIICAIYFLHRPVLGLIIMPVTEIPDAGVRFAVQLVLGVMDFANRSFYAELESNILMIRMGGEWWVVAGTASGIIGNAEIAMYSFFGLVPLGMMSAWQFVAAIFSAQSMSAEIGANIDAMKKVKKELDGLYHKE